MRAHLASLLAAFGRSQSGSVLPLVAVCAVLMVGASGVAIDAARLTLMQSALQRSLDSGGLSALAKLNTSDLEAEVENYVGANFSGGYVGATVTDIETSLSTDEKTLTVSATATMPTTFLNILGIRSADTRAVAEITRATGGLELALVLDNTGSMKDSMGSLKTAANDLLDILFGDDETAEDLYVGLVPFSQAVNIGTDHAGWVRGGAVAALDWGKTSWGGCVMERGSGDDVTDRPPASAPFEPYYWLDNDYTENRQLGFSVNNGNDWLKVGKKKITYDSDMGINKGPNMSCPTAVTPMTSDKGTLETGIAAMRAVGNTHVNIGAAWGWRMLSPQWRGLWGGEMNERNLPLDYNSPNMSKAAVIMTDGANTMDRDVYTAYGWLGQGILGTTNDGDAEDELDDRLAEVCTSMKNAGVTVYTIAFNSPGNTISNLLRSCATQPDFYFSSPNATALRSAFSQIGDSLSSLRVSR